MFTNIFIYIIFGIIVIADIIFLILQNKGSTKWKTITSVFRHWYKEFPFIPYTVGALFIGHFGLSIDFSWIPFEISLTIFIIFSISFLGWCIIENMLKDKSKFYKLCCKVFLIPMAIGSVIGCLWY